MEWSNLFTLSNLINLSIGGAIGIIISAIFYKKIYHLHMFFSYITQRAVKVSIVEGYIQDVQNHRRKFSFHYTGREYPLPVSEVPMSFTYNVIGSNYNESDLKTAIRKHYNEEKGVNLETHKHKVIITNKVTKKIVYKEDIDIDMT